MACGTCLIISEEARSRSWYSNSLIHSQTCLAVQDPTDVDLLTASLRLALTEPEAIESIGHNAYLASSRMSTHDQFITGWENLFSSCMEQRNNS
jgi:hypothetical protein